MNGGLETIAERRERLLRQHALANAAAMRAEFWARKDQQGEGDTPCARGEGEL
jgi:hypothetical protein